MSRANFSPMLCRSLGRGIRRAIPIYHLPRGFSSSSAKVQNFRPLSHDGNVSAPRDHHVAATVITYGCRCDPHTPRAPRGVRVTPGIIVHGCRRAGEAVQPQRTWIVYGAATVQPRSSAMHSCRTMDDPQHTTCRTPIAPRLRLRLLTYGDLGGWRRDLRISCRIPIHLLLDLLPLPGKEGVRPGRYAGSRSRLIHCCLPPVWALS